MIDILAIKKHLNESNIEYEYFGDSLINIDIYSLPDNIKNNSIIWFKDPQKIKEYNTSEYKNLLIVTSPNYDLSDIKGNFLVSWNSKELFFSNGFSLFKCSLQPVSGLVSAIDLTKL